MNAQCLRTAIKKGQECSKTKGKTPDQCKKEFREATKTCSIGESWQTLKRL